MNLRITIRILISKNDNNFVYIIILEIHFIQILKNNLYIKCLLTSLSIIILLLLKLGYETPSIYI
jgi:hypothetical protein